MPCSKVNPLPKSYIFPVETPVTRIRTPIIPAVVCAVPIGCPTIAHGVNPVELTVVIISVPIAVVSFTSEVE